MKISIITLFPQVFDPMLNTSIMKRAQNKNLAEFEFINLRDFGEGRHQVVDDRPYGGGAGMVLKADILTKALKSIRPFSGSKQHVILTSASGKPYKQKDAQKLSKKKHLVIIAGHYEGVDQRFIDSLVDEEISIGDYILTGGEIPAMAIADSVIRLIPGVLEKEEAVKEESFSPATAGLLEYPHYTRPEIFEDKKVPSVLLSGNHGEIKKWREKESQKKTKKLRPDLLK